jgi:hypothetical protein
MLEKLQQQWFWGAVAAIVALLGFVFTHLVGKRRLRYWTLQRLLSRERSFYSLMQPRRRDPRLDPSKTTAEEYVSSVARSLLGFDALPPTVVKETKGELSKLLDNLRATHQTLVAALEPFSLTDAKKFFEKFDTFAAKFGTLYHGGQIPHNARTHCSEITGVIYALNQKMGNVPGWSDISTLTQSVVVCDREVIVPLMIEVLDRTEVELSIIGQAVRARDFRKAVYIKERFWFEVMGFYGDLNESLNKMDSLASSL